MGDLMNTNLADARTASPASENSPQSKATGRWSQGIEWTAFLWIGLVHVGALAAPWCFTWTGLFLALALSWITAGLGVCLGYHRLLTHSSFETYPVIRKFLAWCGMLAGEGPPIMWVANHRKHHQYSDHPGDPHSPNDGPWWSHILWMFPRHKSDEWARLYGQYTPDLLREGFMRFLNRSFLWWQLFVAVLCFSAGWLIGGLPMAVSLLVYGMFVRLVYGMHATWLVNSATHMWGYRNFDINDNSRNLWWVALLTYGEGWHNNHHAQQRSARHGMRWWELDLTWITICCMRGMGLAWNVVEPSVPKTPVSQE